MDRPAIDRMHKRVREVRARRAVRAWQYRQRNHASGVWFRLRRVLADAREAFSVSVADCGELLSEGYVEVPCGRELEPPKLIVFVDEVRLARVASRRPIRVDLGTSFLDAEAVALIPFERR